MAFILSSCATTGQPSAPAKPVTVSGGIEQMVLDAVKQANRDDAEAAGWSVSSSRDGTTIVVGSPYISMAAKGIIAFGRALIYEKTGTGWNVATIVTPVEASSLFGVSTAISADGSTVLVGASGLEPTSDNGIFLYLKSATGWTKGELHPHWMAIPGEKGSKFGNKVALSGDGATILVGAPAEGGHGRVRYFIAPDVGWAKTTSFDQIKSGYLGLSGPQAGDEFGQAVAISQDGSVIAIGAPGRNNEKGGVYLFQKPAAGWTATETLFPVELPEGQPGDRFGQSVSVSKDGSLIAIGANGADGKRGAVYVVSYDRSGSISFTKLSRNDEHTQLGISVDISADGKTIAAGSMGVDGSGAVRTVRSGSGTWKDEKLADEYTPKAERADLKGSLLGFSVDLTDDGSYLFVGSPLTKGGTGDWTPLNIAQQ
jgi:hypothetical protein